MRLQDWNTLTAFTEIETQLCGRGFERLAFLENTLREGVANAVCIGVLHIAAHPIGAGMNGLASKRILLKLETVPCRIKAGKGCQVKTGSLP